MIRKIIKFFKLRREQKKYFLEAFTRLTVMQAAVYLLSFKKLLQSFEKHSSPDVPTLDKSQIQTARDIGTAIQRAANNTIWHSTCLAQALTAQQMLAKRGISGIFYLGARKGDNSSQKLIAHAWLQCQNDIITGARGHKKHTVISSFTW